MDGGDIEGKVLELFYRFSLLTLDHHSPPPSQPLLGVYTPSTHRFTVYSSLLILHIIRGF